MTLKKLAKKTHILAGAIEMAVWRSERLNKVTVLALFGRIRTRLLSINKTDMPLPAQYFLFEEMSIIENRFILTLYSSRGLASYLPTQN